LVKIIPCTLHLTPNDLTTYPTVWESTPAVAPHAKLPVGERTVSPVSIFTLVSRPFMERRRSFVFSKMKKLSPEIDLNVNTSGCKIF